MIILGSVIFLKEKPNISHLILACIGFSGVLFILKPGQSSVSMAIYWAVLGAMLGATIQLMLKKMSSKDSSNTLIAWNLICTVPLSASVTF